jgi:hypothetical protein
MRADRLKLREGSATNLEISAGLAIVIGVLCAGRFRAARANHGVASLPASRRTARMRSSVGERRGTTPASIVARVVKEHPARPASCACVSPVRRRASRISWLTPP